MFRSGIIRLFLIGMMGLLAGGCAVTMAQPQEDALKIRGQPEEIDLVAMYKVVEIKGVEKKVVGYVEKRAIYYPARATPVWEFSVMNSRLEPIGFITDSGRAFKFLEGREGVEEIGKFDLKQGISLLLDVPGEINVEEIDSAYLKQAELVK